MCIGLNQQSVSKPKNSDLPKTDSNLQNQPQQRWRVPAVASERWERHTACAQEYSHYPALRDGGKEGRREGGKEGGDKKKGQRRSWAEAAGVRVWRWIISAKQTVFSDRHQGLCVCVCWFRPHEAPWEMRQGVSPDKQHIITELWDRHLFKGSVHTSYTQVQIFLILLKPCVMVLTSLAKVLKKHVPPEQREWECSWCWKHINTQKSSTMCLPENNGPVTVDIPQTKSCLIEGNNE